MYILLSTVPLRFRTLLITSSIDQNKLSLTCILIVIFTSAIAIIEQALSFVYQSLVS